MGIRIVYMITLVFYETTNINIFRVAVSTSGLDIFIKEGSFVFNQRSHLMLSREKVAYVL